MSDIYAVGKVHPGPPTTTAGCAAATAAEVKADAISVPEGRYDELKHLPGLVVSVDETHRDGCIRYYSDTLLVQIQVV